MEESQGFPEKKKPSINILLIFAGIFLIIIIFGGIFIWFSLDQSQEQTTLGERSNQESDERVQGQECISFCNSAPEGCYYDYSDDRYIVSTNPDDYEDYYASPRTNVYTGCLVYPCGVLTCDNYSTTCTKEDVNEATIQLGETKIITGLTIQLGNIGTVVSGLSGILVYGNGLSNSIYESSLPQFSLVEIYDEDYKSIVNYSVEKVSMTSASITLRVFCGEEEYSKNGL